MEKSGIKEFSEAVVKKVDSCSVHGVYRVQCHDKDGNLKWEDTIDNVVTAVGKNLMLDQTFGGTQNSTYFLGLISSVGYTGIPVDTDTMASHATSGHVWNEAGNGSNYPNWSGSNVRQTITWSAASGGSKTIASPASFTIATNGGTVKGCFIVTGSGASATNNNTSGVLYSAGVFSNGDKVVSVGDTLTVPYTTSLT